MAAYTNANRAPLILPDGTSVPHGGTVNVTGALADNAGVKSWIEGGQLVKGKAEADEAPAAPKAAPK